MKRLLLSLLLVGFLLSIGGMLVWAQNNAVNEPFTPIRQLFRPIPTGILYDPQFDRLALTDETGDLELWDARTFTPQFTLYEAKYYNEYKFSLDGRWLAVAIEQRLDIWDTQTGTLNATLNPQGTLGVEGPLWFSEDANYIVFNSRVPAPQSLRRSENDTVLVPWIWDLRDARNEAPPSLPNFVSAFPFFDYRNGLILGRGGKIVAGLPARLQIMIVDTDGVQVLHEIPDPDRIEVDPISAWVSASNGWMYIRPETGGSLVQINADSGFPTTLPIGRDLGVGAQAILENYTFPPLAQIIGEPNSVTPNSLLTMLLGENYNAAYSYHPLTVILLDILKPITPQAGQDGFLVYIRDETTGIGTLDFLRPPNATHIVLHPDGQHLLLRPTMATSGAALYEIASGNILLNYFSVFPNDPENLLAFNATGDELVGYFERWNAANGWRTFANPHYDPRAYDTFSFSADSAKLTTFYGSLVWDWEIDSETILRRVVGGARGDFLAVSPDNRRYLTRIDTVYGTGIEIVDTGTEDEIQLLFEKIPNRDIIDIVPNATWENFLVVYSAYPYSQHYPGNEIALYSLDKGKEWFIAGDDLPASLDSSYYGWLDEDTVFVETEGGSTAPQRVYGVDYDPSGVPECLVKQYPQDWQRWMPLWERLNANLGSAELHTISQRICEVAENTTTADQVDAFFTPTPTPTQPVGTPRPRVIPGVPACLTQRFTSEALQYAEAWRRITEGLSPAEVEQQERLLCAGLVGDSSPQYDFFGQDSHRYMTIEMATGERILGFGELRLPADPLGRNLDLVLQRYERQFRRYPDQAALSPDGTLLAVGKGRIIEIYRVNLPYEDIAATATATLSALEPERLLAVQPTATPQPAYLGEARPTLTPTMTLTPPPTPDAVFDLSQRDAVEEICPFQTLFTLDNPAPNYAPKGDLSVSIINQTIPYPARFNLITGEYQFDLEIIPLQQCGNGFDCMFNLDRSWVVVYAGGAWVVRPDGTDAQQVLTAQELEVTSSLYWRTPTLLQYEYQDFLPDKYLDEVALHRTYDVLTGERSAPFEPVRISYTYNLMSTDLISWQPIEQRFAVVRTQFTAANSIGYKYYLFDAQNNTFDHFARFADEPDSIEFQWHPLGRYLYYRYPIADGWMVFDPTTQTHQQFGELPSGVWSTDGRYRIEWYRLPGLEQERRLRREEELPKIEVWDSATGAKRRYCIPTTGETTFSSEFNWSPDSRYVWFFAALPTPPDYEITRSSLLLLDTQTGAITDLGTEIESVWAWLEEKKP